jgi:hypothetical protein
MTKKKSYSAPLKVPSNQKILEALDDVRALARIIREALPVQGLKGRYPSTSPAIRQHAEDDAAWHLIRLARVTLPGAFQINAAVALPWDSLGRVVAEIREFWGWADQDGESRIPCSRARDGKKLKPLPSGLLEQLESDCRLLEAGAKILPDDSNDPDLEKTAEAYRLWQAGRHTWPEIAEQLEGDRKQAGAIKQAVGRYAQSRGLPLRKGQSGRPRKT